MNATRRTILALLVLGGIAPIATSETYDWQYPGDGLFQDDTKWWGGHAPGPTDVATFNIVKGIDYTIYFNGNTETSTLNASPQDGGSIHFDLSGYEYVLSGSVPYTINISWGPARFSNGTLSGPNAGLLLESSSTMTVNNGGIVSVRQANVGATYGGSGGELSVQTGGSVSLSQSMLLHHGGVLRVGTGGTAQVLGTVQLEPFASAPGSIVMEGGTLTAGQVVSSGNISGFGTVQTNALLDESSLIAPSGGNLEIGDSTSLNGFTSTGLIEVGNATLTLNAMSFANLGQLTTLEGGTLRAGNGVYLAGTRTISGWGQVDASIAAAVGSNIYATGSLRLGDSTAFDGVDLDGRLFVGSHTVTLDDRNQAVLGPLTTIEGGTLASPNGILLREGDNLVGYGDVTGDLTTQGYVYGEPAGLDFYGNVSGRGTFEGNVTFHGTYSPGNSPAATEFEDVAFAATAVLLMEIGGLVPNDEHDQVNVSDEALLDGNLRLVLIDGYTPLLGDELVIMTFGQRVGEFSFVEGTDLGNGLLFDVRYGANDLRLEVVPEPTALSLLALGGLAILKRSRNSNA